MWGYGFGTLATATWRHGQFVMHRLSRTVWEILPHMDIVGWGYFGVGVRRWPRSSLLRGSWRRPSTYQGGRRRRPSLLGVVCRRLPIIWAGRRRWPRPAVSPWSSLTPPAHLPGRAAAATAVSPRGSLAPPTYLSGRAAASTAVSPRGILTPPTNLPGQAAAAKAVSPQGILALPAHLMEWVAGAWRRPPIYWSGQRRPRLSLLRSTNPGKDTTSGGRTRKSLFVFGVWVSGKVGKRLGVAADN